MANSTDFLGGLAQAPDNSSLVLKSYFWLQQNASIWSILFTSFVALCIYDQISYIIKKGSIVGPKFKIWPIMGPFLESVNPKFEE